MIDTLYIGLDEEMPIDFLDRIPANEAFSPTQMPGWSGRLETTKPSSHYYQFHGAEFMLTLCHDETGVTVTGPVLYHRGYWLCATIRANIPRLAGLPDVWLPENDGEIQTALTKLEQLLTWLPDGWKLRAKIKELHLSMNFDFTGNMSAPDVMGAHQLMRHKRVRPDPLKFKPSHKTLYWKGKDTVIALYEKTTEACSRLAKERNTTVDEIRKRYHLNELLRLEFRLKTPALIKLLDRILPAPPVPADGPPLPKSASSNLPLSILTKDIMERMFRAMAFDFGDLPVRKPERLTTKTFLAMLIKEECTCSDGTPVIEYAARFMPDRQVKEAKAMARSVDTGGGPVFRWRDYLGDTGWGPCAMPKPECFGDLSDPAYP